VGIGLRRPMLAIVAMRGMSSFTSAVLATTVSTVIILFGWCVSDSVFSFCFLQNEIFNSETFNAS